MQTRVLLLLGLLGFTLAAHAIGKQEVADILLAEYPDANITEIEREMYRGQRIFEIDFEYEGEKLEAIIAVDRRAGRRTAPESGSDRHRQAALELQSRSGLLCSVRGPAKSPSKSMP